MPRHTERHEQIRLRWASFLGKLVGKDRAVSVAALAESLNGTKGRMGDNRAEIYAWLAGKQTARAETVFEVGEALRGLGVGWSSGALALFSANYNGEFFATMRALTVTTEDAEAALALFDAAPIVAAEANGLLDCIERAPLPTPPRSFYTARDRGIKSFVRVFGIARKSDDDESAESRHAQSIDNARRKAVVAARRGLDDAHRRLAEGFSAAKFVEAVEKAFRNRERPPRRSGTAWQRADAVITAAIDLAQADWIGAYEIALRWHRLTFAEIASGFPYWIEHPGTDAYCKLLEIAEFSLKIDPASHMERT